MLNNFFPENRALYEIMRKSKVERGRPQMTIKYDACALHAGYLRLHTHTHSICNTYFFSTATLVTRTRLSVTLYAHCLSWSVITNVHTGFWDPASQLVSPHSGLSSDGKAVRA